MTEPDPASLEGAPGERAAVGVDEWVARSGERQESLPGPLGAVQRAFGRVGWWPRLAAAVLAGALIPQFGLNDFQFQIGINMLLLALLAVGLNISVGWAGLLDLGYIAFYGFGAYGFALLSSSQIGGGIHWPAYASVPVVMIAAGVLGLLVGLPSRRLIGDYLAIVTLFFGEAFVEFTNNVASGTLGGPNGITSIDPYKGFGAQITTNKGYFYLLLVLLAVVCAAVHMLDRSRLGRAWRAVREDPLAAGLMTIPVNRVKLMAFSFGAAIAALAGTVFAAQQISVFPTDFDTPFLILIYAALILGGAGSIGGAVIGGLIIAITLDGFLRSPTQSGYIFYGMIVLTLVVKLRPWRKLAAVAAAIVAFGLAMHALVSAVSASAVAGGPQSSGWIADVVRHWVIVPSNPTGPGNIGFVILICALIAIVQLRGRWRTMLIVPTVYLALCVWEARLVGQPAITRQLLIGAILIVMMNARPQGLLGSRRVEIV